jgi:hypothetical protein
VLGVPRPAPLTSAHVSRRPSMLDVVMSINSIVPASEQVRWGRPLLPGDDQPLMGAPDVEHAVPEGRRTVRRNCVSVHRKCLGQKSQLCMDADVEALSITRLEGSRWHGDRYGASEPLG